MSNKIPPIDINNESVLDYPPERVRQQIYLELISIKYKNVIDNEDIKKINKLSSFLASYNILIDWTIDYCKTQRIGKPKKGNKGKVNQRFIPITERITIQTKAYKYL